jgi:hypothetical protein
MFWLGTSTKCGRIKLINVIPLSSTKKNLHRFTFTKKKPAQIHFHSKNPHNITKMNENINMDGTIEGSVNVHR